MKNPTAIITNYEFEPLEASIKSNRENHFVDVVIIHTSNSALTWKHLQQQFEIAQQTYSKHGVYLNLTEAVQVSIPPNWHKLLAEKTSGKQVQGPIDFYDRIELEKLCLSDQAISIFENLVADRPNSNRTVFLITLNDVSIEIFEEDDSGSFHVVEYPVGGLSFPGYVFSSRIPNHLRGVITLGNRPDTISMVAHELGHKLINVSHEGKDAPPHFSGHNIPGLLGYAGDTTIYGGEEGRWHLERLKKSPFLYKLENGKKIWNKDYQKSGIYRDPIYGSYSMAIE